MVITMKKWCQLQGILWKQYLIRHKIWFVGIIAASLFVGISGAIKGNEEEAVKGIAVGICAQDKAGMALSDSLARKEGIFRFLPYEEEETLRRDVENGSLECGYLLPRGFFENMAKGKIRRQIRLYYSPGSVAHKISYEVVFEELFRMLSDEVLKGYAASGILTEKNASAEEKKGLTEELLQLKEQYETNGSTFFLQYEAVKKEQALSEEGTNGAPPTLDIRRGVIAIFIFLMSLVGLGNCLEIKEKGRHGFCVKAAEIMGESSLHIAITGSILSGAVLLFVSGSMRGIGKETAGLFWYFAALEIYLRLYLLLFRKAERIYALIPVLLLGSALLCPVFFRMEAYIPAAAFLQKLFPVSWYLNFT